MTIAPHLAASGWDVIGGVRTEADAARLRAEDSRLTPIMLDVTDENHIAALGESLPQRLDAVVNNAGVAIGGPLETVPPGELRKQLDINVIGQIAVTQAVLPRLRASRGRIVFISSLNGKIAFPLFGCLLCIEIRDRSRRGRAAARTEAVGHSRLSVVEPAQTDTDMWRTADAMVDDTDAAMTDDGRATLRQTHCGTEEIDTGVAKDRCPAGEGRGWWWRRR